MKRLAITISGAVSLGSFEAGVIYEVLRAIGQHNQDPATTADERILVDVLTGASAGGMTAAIAAQKLLFDANALDGVATNAFYQPWVKEVSLQGLLDLQDGEDSALSIFSSNLVEDIARKHLTARYANGAHPPANRHPAADAKVKLGLAMSNLTGVDYGVQLLTGGDFVYTRFQDEFIVPLDSAVATHDSAATWEGIRNAAVACGAFPFAFRIKEVLRDPASFGPDAQLPATNDRYAYTDGGTFQNEPLGLAKNLVDLVDPEHLHHDDRHYLFVAPNLRSSVMDAQDHFPAYQATFAKAGKRLVTAVFNQARYHDWVHVEQVNQRVLQFDVQAIELIRLLKAGTLDPAALTAVTQGIAVAFNDAPGLAAAANRLRQQFASDLAGLDAAKTTVWANAAAVLERVVGVQDHDVMRIYAVSASDKELAGSCLMYFGGFFAERYREHDYQVGRQKAQAFLLDPAAQGALGPIRYANPEPIGPIDPALTDVHPADLPEDLRDDLKDQIVERAHVAMKELGLNLAAREIVDKFFVSPQVKKFLEL